MKLISFAIVSILAIAVSAQPPLSTSAADNTPQYAQEEVNTELARLIQDYEERKTEFGLLSVELEEAEDEKEGYKSEEEYTKGALGRDDLDDAKRQKLEVALEGASEDFEKASEIVLVKQQQLEDAKERLGVAKVKVLALTDNQEQISQHNAGNGHNSLTVSTGCYYNKRVLDQQIKEACQEDEGASGSSQSIDDYSSELDKMTQRVGDPKNTPNREFRKHLGDPPREPEVVKVSMQVYCAYLKELRNDLGE